MLKQLLDGLKQWALRLTAPSRVHYINGPEILPPPLTPEEEARVFAGLEEGRPSCRDLLITHNLRLVVYIARKFENSGVAIEDIISIGTIGLIKAVNTFVPSKKIKLATYASRCIENEILMYLRKSSNRRQDASIDEPLNTDGEGNELLLSDVLSSDQAQVGAKLEQDDECTGCSVGRAGAPHYGNALWTKGWGGAHAKGSGGCHRHFPKLHFTA